MSENDLVTGERIYPIYQRLSRVYEVCGEARLAIYLHRMRRCASRNCLDVSVRKAEERTGIHVVPTYVCAYVRQETPMVAVRSDLLAGEKESRQGGTLIARLIYTSRDDSACMTSPRSDGNQDPEVGRKKPSKNTWRWAGRFQYHTPSRG